jgi:hypothetical protein
VIYLLDLEALLFAGISLSGSGSGTLLLTDRASHWGIGHVDICHGDSNGLVSYVICLASKSAAGKCGCGVDETGRKRFGEYGFKRDDWQEVLE